MAFVFQVVLLISYINLILFVLNSFAVAVTVPTTQINMGLIKNPILNETLITDQAVVVETKMPLIMQQLQDTEQHYIYKENPHQTKEYSVKEEHHESTDEQTKGNRGVDDKENHLKEFEEYDKIHNTFNDEDNHSSHHHTANGFDYSGKYNGGDNYKKRRKEKGFHNSYHKKEYNKNDNFFNNAHQDGNYLKHGKFSEKHLNVTAAHEDEKTRDGVILTKNQEQTNIADETKY